MNKIQKFVRSAWTKVLAVVAIIGAGVVESQAAFADTVTSVQTELTTNVGLIIASVVAVAMLWLGLYYTMLFLRKIRGAK